MVNNIDVRETASENRPTRRLWLVRPGVSWAALSLSAASIAELTPENLTLFTAIPLSGLYPLLLRVARPTLLPRFATLCGSASLTLP